MLYGLMAATFLKAHANQLDKIVNPKYSTDRKEQHNIEHCLQWYPNTEAMNTC